MVKSSNRSLSSAIHDLSSLTHHVFKTTPVLSAKSSFQPPVLSFSNLNLASRVISSKQILSSVLCTKDCPASRVMSSKQLLSQCHQLYLASRIMSSIQLLFLVSSALSCLRGLTREYSAQPSSFSTGKGCKASISRY